MNVIDIRDLSFAYGDERVLREVSLPGLCKGNTRCCWVRTGREEYILKLLLGELNPQQGTICLFGGDTRKVFSDKIGYRSQKQYFPEPPFPATVEVNVFTNLYSQIGWFRLPGKKQRQQAATGAALKQAWRNTEKAGSEIVRRAAASHAGEGTGGKSGTSGAG